MKLINSVLFVAFSVCTCAMALLITATLSSCLHSSEVKKMDQKTEVHIVPKCADLVKDFYADVSQKNMIVGPPFSNFYSLSFVAIDPIDTNELRTICLMSKTIDKDKSGCANPGDLVGSCDMGGNVGEFWYGYGKTTIKESANLKT